MSDPLKITFIPSTVDPIYKEMFLVPEPAVRHVPEWYKSLAKFDQSNDEKTLHPENHIGTDGAVVNTKQCPPFLDAMTAGYLYLLEDDLHVDLDEDGRPTLWWAGEVMLADKRPVVDLPIPDNFHPIHYGWRMNWYYETPPGYSLLVTHPMNRYDLPFQVQSGIIESDIWGLPVFTAFFLKRNFRGVIPKGTPIFQMIPFKRDNWQLEVDDSPETLDKHELLAEDRRSSIHGHYKKTTWRKKIFSGIPRKNRNEN
jgi:hypothetical protein